RRLHAVARTVPLQGHLGSALAHLRRVWPPALPVGDRLDTRGQGVDVSGGGRGISRHRSPVRQRQGGAHGRVADAGLQLGAVARVSGPWRNHHGGAALHDPRPRRRPGRPAPTSGPYAFPRCDSGLRVGLWQQSGVPQSLGPLLAHGLRLARPGGTTQSLAPLQDLGGWSEHLRLSRFKLSGPPTPRDTEASNAYAIMHDALGPVCMCSLIGINSKLFALEHDASQSTRALLASHCWRPWWAPSGRGLAMPREEVGSLIHRLLERLARSEADHSPGRNRGSDPGLGVAPVTRPLVVDLPRAKAA